MIPNLFNRQVLSANELLLLKAFSFYDLNLLKNFLAFIHLFELFKIKELFKACL
ncbi:hypothetical protein HPCPY1662_1086 [Helicobacter pylori CPY1662]|nr:hypothetical protein HPCPY1662_1086 [Helicobacter pylori CPY1662]